MKKYAKQKIELLKDFQVRLTSADIEKIMNAKSTLEVDRIARDFLQPYDI